jgi:polyhydroxyalkanoate synthase subunit PhaE
MANTKAKSPKTLGKIVATQKENAAKAVKVAKDLTKNLPLVNESIDKGHEMFNSVTDQTVKMIENFTEQTTQTTQNLKNTMEQSQNFFQTWLENQMNMAKTMFNQNQTTDFSKFWQDAMANFNNADFMQNNPLFANMTNTDWITNNPMANMMNMDFMKNNPMMANMMNMDWMKNNPMMANMMNMDWMKNNPMMANMMNMDWMKNNPMMANMMNMDWMKNNPMAQYMNVNDMMTKMQDQMKNGASLWANYTNDYTTNMNQMYTNWTKQFENLTTADAFKGMFNMTNGLTSFFNLWQPFMNQIKDGTFNVESFMANLKTTDYKTFMDQFFNLMPENVKAAAMQMNATFVENMKKMSEQGMTAYNFLSNTMQNNPMMQNNPFANALSMYTQFRDTATESLSPLTKLMQDNATVKQTQIWNDIADKMVTFNIKNSELQAMMYAEGAKVMEEVAKSVYTKVQNGENFDSVIKVYQEWMMKADNIYTKMFESDEYSKLMTEVASLQMKLRQSINEQMEQSFMGNFPIATRSQMDEVYKMIYDLKNEMRAGKRPVPATATQAKATTAPKAAPAKAATAKKATPAKPAAKKTAKKK